MLRTAVLILALSAGAAAVLAWLAAWRDRVRPGRGRPRRAPNLTRVAAFLTVAAVVLGCAGTALPGRWSPLGTLGAPPDPAHPSGRAEPLDQAESPAEARRPGRLPVPDEAPPEGTSPPDAAGGGTRPGPGAAPGAAPGGQEWEITFQPHLPDTLVAALAEAQAERERGPTPPRVVLATGDVTIASVEPDAGRIVLVNGSRHPVSLTGWSLQVRESGAWCHFTGDLVLLPGEELELSLPCDPEAAAAHTPGETDRSGCVFVWTADRIWPATGPVTVVLFDSQGEIRHSKQVE
ncbi:MAG TPA: hypothetical protein DHW14_01535 [Clostridiales bacterium]|nr:hypothetical protein [Clostridiales bacterium]